MGNKVGNKMKQANTIKDTVGDNWETTDKHKRNKVGDRQGGRQVGDTVRNAVGDKLGDNLETRWQGSKAMVRGAVGEAGRHSGRQG